MSFDDVVRSALDTLPPHIAAALRNVAVVVEDENAEDPDLYGLFDGIPLTEGGPAPGELPNRIAIYRRPLEDDFPDDGRAPRRDPHHRAPRARPLLRPRRGSPLGAGLRMTTALELLTWAALGLGVVVVAVFLFARRR